MIDYKELEEFAERFKVGQGELDKLAESCVKELGARFLRSVTLKTPVGIYPQGSGKVGGTLRRGWTALTHEDAVKKNVQTIPEHLEGTNVSHRNGKYELVIDNPVEYASYVEYGHRAGLSGWVEGRHMMQKAEEELRPNAQAIVNRKIQKWMEAIQNGE